MPMPTRLLSATVGLALTLTLTACGSDDEPDPIPGGTASPEATASPAPDAPELSADQTKAYEAALTVYTDYQAYVTRLSQDPDSTEGTEDVFSLATTEQIQGLADELSELTANDAYVEGERDVTWTVPVSVSDDEVVLRQCRTPGSWVLVGKDGQRAPKTKNSVAKVSVITADGDWYVANVESDGPC